MDDRIERTVETYETVAEEYQSLHGDRSSVAPVVDGFRERLQSVPIEDDRPPRLLDAGCGPGWESTVFADAGFDVVGLDITSSFLADAQRRGPTASFVRGDMRRLPVATNAVEGVFVLASLLHVPKSAVGDALAEFVRVLVRGGVLTVVMKGADAERDDSPYVDRPASLRVLRTSHTRCPARRRGVHDRRSRNRRSVDPGTRSPRLTAAVDSSTDSDPDRVPKL